MPTKEMLIEETKIGIKILEAMYDRLKDICSEDDKVLKAIQENIKKLNKQFLNKYKIYLYNGYPCISIAHNKIRIHQLIGEYLFGEINGYFIHHKDKNKLNNTEGNLQLLTKKEHTQIHHKNKKYIPSLKAIKNARKTNYKKHITKEKCLELRNKGLTIKQISKELICSINTINRRLGMKDYKTKNNVSDWSG